MSSGAAATYAPLTASSIGPCGKISLPARTLFHHLGFRLVVHQRDFFYFRGKDSLSPQASRMAVFVFILIESLADQGEPVVDTLMTRTFTIADLPHLKGARYRAYLQEAGAFDEDELRGIVRQLERFDFIQRHTEDSFTFRTPAYRDLQTLNLRIDELNRRFGRVSISNLSRLRLILREHAEWTRRIITVVEVEAMPLYFLREKNGRIMLDPKTSLLRIERSVSYGG